MVTFGHHEKFISGMNGYAKVGQESFYLKAKIAPASLVLFWGLLSSLLSCPYNPHGPQRAGRGVCGQLVLTVPRSLTDEGTAAHTALNRAGSAHWEP